MLCSARKEKLNYLICSSFLTILFNIFSLTFIGSILFHLNSIRTLLSLLFTMSGIWYQSPSILNAKLSLCLRVNNNVLFSYIFKLFFCFCFSSPLGYLFIMKQSKHTRTAHILSNQWRFFFIHMLLRVVWINSAKWISKACGTKNFPPGTNAAKLIDISESVTEINPNQMKEILRALVESRKKNWKLSCHYINRCDKWIFNSR